MKYEIIFKGATFKNRCIEVYIPEYNHSQFILPAPLGSDHIFGLTSDDFWRSHIELRIAVNNICENIAYKHLWFLMGWDLCDEKNRRSEEEWEFWISEWKNRCSRFRPNDQQYRWAYESFEKKYVREKGQRVYKYIPRKIYTYEDKIELLNTAVDLAGDGGCDPFTDEERIVINDFLLEIKNKFINK